MTGKTAMWTTSGVIRWRISGKASRAVIRNGGGCEKDLRRHAEKIGAIGFSGMMHGYMPLDKEGKLLVPFRTWRKHHRTGCRVPYRGIQLPDSSEMEHRPSLPGDPQRRRACEGYPFTTTLAGYIHWKLSRRKGTWVSARPPACSPLMCRSWISIRKNVRSVR